MATVKCVTCGTENEESTMLKHDGNFCCVTEGCYVPLMKEATTMNAFTMDGFKHISGEGVIEFLQLLQQQGTIDLLWDMQPKTKINALMQSENFDMDAHIKTNYCDHDGIVYDYDEIVTDMLDEMLETIITLEYCFIYDVYNIDFKGRSFKNLDSIPESKVWSPNVYLPITKGRVFSNFDDFEAYCMDTLCEPNDPGHVAVDIQIDAPTEEECGENLTTQILDYTISGAADSNCLRNVIEAYQGWGYTHFIFTLK